MERLRPKIKLKSADKAAESVQPEGTQDHSKGDPVDIDANVRHGEGFFPVITGGIKRKRAPRAAERKTKEKLSFTFSKGSIMQSVPVTEDLSDDEENVGKECVEEDIKMTDEKQIMAGSNRGNSEPVEVKSLEQVQQRQGPLKLKVKTFKFREGPYVPPEKQKSSDNDNSAESVKECQKPASTNSEKLNSLFLKPSRSLDQPTIPRQTGSRHNETRSSPHHSEMEKFYSSTENQEKGLTEELYQKHKKQSHAFEKGPSDQSEYNKKELVDALMVVKKIMKMDAAEPFNIPVNPDALGIPDYFDIIDTPMDLGTICSALERGEKYRNSRDVFKDVQFIWDNCYKYNSKGDPILDLMKRVKKNFVKYWTAAGLYYESPKRASGMQFSGQGDTTTNREHGGVDESEMEHEGKDNPDGNKNMQTGKINLMTPQLSGNSSELKDEQVAIEHLTEESGRREGKISQRTIEEIEAQHCDQESKAEMDAVQSTVNNPIVVNKGVKFRIKNSKFECEVQENSGLISKKADQTSIGTDEESGLKPGHSVKSLQEETKQQDLHPKSKTRRRHGKYHHKEGCLCAVCNARRRRHAREESALLAKAQSTMVDIDSSETMKEKLDEFPKKLLSDEDGIKMDHTASAELIAQSCEHGNEDKVETQKREVKGYEKEECCRKEGTGKHGQESKKQQYPGQEELQMQLEKDAQQEEENESPIQQEEEEKESLMEQVEEEEQQEGKVSKKQQEEVQGEVKDGQTQEDEEAHQQEEVDIQQQEGDSGKDYPANYDIPLQYANPSITQMCEVLFTRNPYSFWNQAHSLTYEPSKKVSENQILAAMSTFME